MRVKAIYILPIPLALAFLTIYLLLASPDIEHFLRRAWPGGHAADAFEQINEAAPLFAAMLSFTSAVCVWILSTGNRSLFIPLVTGPLLTGFLWLISTDLRDPIWFHLVAFTTIGMLASCVVTILLAAFVIRWDLRRDSNSH